MISTRDLSALPDPHRLRRVMQSLAVLDAVIQPEWEFRYYSFTTRWGHGDQCGSMRNGSGDDLVALFNQHGCFIRGFAHEYLTSPYRTDPPRLWPGLLDGVPAEFATCLTEPAFAVSEQTTFCIWRRFTDPFWQVGPVEFPPDHPDPDGSEFLLSAYDGEPDTYRAWAEDYYERTVPLAAVRAVYDHAPLTAELVAALNPERELDDLRSELDEIGYPAN